MGAGQNFVFRPRKTSLINPAVVTRETRNLNHAAFCAPFLTFGSAGTGSSEIKMVTGIFIWLALGWSVLRMMSPSTGPADVPGGTVTVIL